MTTTPRPGNEEPDTTASESERIFQLEEEVDQLKEAVASHAVVDQAIGMLVALGHVSPDQGWEVLREVSQHANIKLRNVAELILIWGRDGELPEHLRVLLEETLDRYGPTQLPEEPPSH
ncbi:ANTAR domain-containing protein [Streptomyces sp. NPDC004096]|uniref:ANTAR domain-containing protein n=1 Tax=unclassified Streptomyces TaxID=2593676 RepID=UPI0033AE6C08